MWLPAKSSETGCGLSERVSGIPREYEGPCGTLKRRANDYLLVNDRRSGSWRVPRATALLILPGEF